MIANRVILDVYADWGIVTDVDGRDIDHIGSIILFTMPDFAQRPVAIRTAAVSTSVSTIATWRFGTAKPTHTTAIRLRVQTDKRQREEGHPIIPTIALQLFGAVEPEMDEGS